MKAPIAKYAPAAEAENIAAIILAAGPRKSLPFPKALAPFGAKTAIERAVKTCADAPGFHPVVVVLGSEAESVLESWKPPRDVVVVQNPKWQQGQLSSLRAGLRHVSRNSAFLIYPVDYPLITTGVLARLRWAYLHRAGHQDLVVPVMGGRDGHPILVAPELRGEFVRAKTARDVVHRPDRQWRVLRLRGRDIAIFRDFDSPSTYRQCVRLLRGRIRA